MQYVMQAPTRHFLELSHREVGTIRRVSAMRHAHHASVSALCFRHFCLGGNQVVGGAVALRSDLLVRLLLAGDQRLPLFNLHVGGRA